MYMQKCAGLCMCAKVRDQLCILSLVAVHLDFFQDQISLWNPLITDQVKGSVWLCFSSIGLQMCVNTPGLKKCMCVCVYVIHTYVHVYSLYVYVEARGESLNLESAFLARWIWHCAPLISWGSWCMPPCLAFIGVRDPNQSITIAQQSRCTPTTPSPQPIPDIVQMSSGGQSPAFMLVQQALYCQSYLLRPCTAGLKKLYTNAQCSFGPQFPTAIVTKYHKQALVEGHKFIIPEISQHDLYQLKQKRWRVCILSECPTEGGTPVAFSDFTFHLYSLAHGPIPSAKPADTSCGFVLVQTVSLLSVLHFLLSFGCPSSYQQVLLHHLEQLFCL